MRVIGRAKRQARRSRRRHISAVSCQIVRHHDGVTARRPHTKLYEQSDRERLGKAVARAREAAGFKFRPAFEKASGVGSTSLYKLEAGDPVGPTVYEAAARALPNWTEDTPRLILEGADPPPTTPMEQAAPDVPLALPSNSDTELSDEDKLRLDVLKNMIGVEALKDEVRYQLLAHLLEAEGVRMTPQTLNTILSEVERLKAEQRISDIQKANGSLHGP